MCRCPKLPIPRSQSIGGSETTDRKEMQSPTRCGSTPPALTHSIQLANNHRTFAVVLKSQAGRENLPTHQTMHFNRPRDNTCNPPFQWYVCEANGFTGCCSDNTVCDLDTCPVANRPGNAVTASDLESPLTGNGVTPNNIGRIHHPLDSYEPNSKAPCVHIWPADHTRHL